MRPWLSACAFILLVLIGSTGNRDAIGQDSEALKVKAEVGPGPYLVGHGIELRVGVIAGGLRPKVEAPRIAGARVWAIDTTVTPLTSTGIGRLLTEQNRFVFRFRVLPGRAGTLEIPAIAARLKGRSGRSQPRNLSIERLPLSGRPAEFLGGVGRFELHAEAVPPVVRVGQDLEFRIKVTGSGAWGMTSRPDLGRFGRLALGLRIEPRPDETTDEPPSRTFVYRLRPSRAGEAVLPPISIAAYDPSANHYVMQVTSGVALRAVAVPAFDPSSVKYDSPTTGSSGSASSYWAVALSAILLTATFMLMRRSWRRLPLAPRFGPGRSRRFAAKAARELMSLQLEACREPLDFVFVAARRTSELLSLYIRHGTGHSPGVLTPDEARLGVARITNSDELAKQAGQLMMGCDSMLYRDQAPGTVPVTTPDVTPQRTQQTRELLDEARRLFEALGRVRSSDRHGS